MTRAAGHAEFLFGFGCFHHGNGTVWRVMAEKNGPLYHGKMRTTLGAKLYTAHCLFVAPICLRIRCFKAIYLAQCCFLHWKVAVAFCNLQCQQWSHFDVNVSFNLARSFMRATCHLSCSLIMLLSNLLCAVQKKPSELNVVPPANELSQQLWRSSS